jgi:FkbM family methyltransferase
MIADEYKTDGVAEYLLTLFPTTFTGIMLDIGAFDPFWLSSSWLLESFGWEVYCIEPNPNRIDKLTKYRKNVSRLAISNINKDDVELFRFSVPILSENGEAAGTGIIDHRQGVSGEYHKSIFSGTSIVNVRTINWFMENVVKAANIDVLSIDVERNEMNVLMGIDFTKYRPKIIVIERLEVEDETQEKFLREKGYSNTHRIAFNDFYIENDYYNNEIVQK